MKTKTVIILFLVILVIGVIFYFAVKKKRPATTQPVIITETKEAATILPNSPEDLALRTYRAATGQNSI